MITYTIAIDQNDDGSFADAGDVITPDVLELRWRLGMAQPHDSMAALTTAEITVRNLAGAYSPEQTGLLPGKRIRIQSDDGTTTRTHFTGYIYTIEPVPGTLGNRNAVIQVRGVNHWIAQNTVRPAAQIDVRADEVIEAILGLCKLRYPVLSGYLIIGTPSYFNVGRLLFGEALERDFEAGKTVFSYTGDMWGGGVGADAAIRQYAETERGRFFIDRDGGAVFYNRHHTVRDTTVKAEFANSMDGLDYSFGAAVINQVEVRVTPRRVGADNSLLWSLDDQQKLAPGVVRRIVARYRDSNENPLGALQISRVVGTASTLPDAPGANVSSYVLIRVVQVGASAAVLEIENTYPAVVYLNGLEVYGTPLIQGSSAVVVEQDAHSQTFYGISRLPLDFPALTSVEEASGLAMFEIMRRRVSRGKVRTLRTSTATHPTETLALTLFDRITVTEAHTGHDADYFIVAEEHHIDRGGLRHRVAWLLEPVLDDDFYIIGQHLLNGTHFLLY